MQFRVGFILISITRNYVRVMILPAQIMAAQTGVGVIPDRNPAIKWETNQSVISGLTHAFFTTSRCISWFNRTTQRSVGRASDKRSSRGCAGTGMQSDENFPIKEPSLNWFIASLELQV